MAHRSDDFSVSSGIESVTPFPPLEDDNHVGGPTATIADNEDDALHMKDLPRRSRAGTTHSTIYTGPLSPSTRLLGGVTTTRTSADSQDPEDNHVISPTIEIEGRASNETDFQAHYFAEHDSLVGIEGESLDSEGEELGDDDDDNDEDDDEDDDDDDDDDDDEEDGEENEDNNGFNNNSNAVGMQRPFMQSSTSLSGPHAFAPPFYNRPPTPLPPSPSLTSLLRPPFSTTTSRPTTPDTSDGETPNDTEAAVAKSARIATTVPRASPKVPTYEYYGFALYLTSSFAFLIYLLWSYLPSPFLHQLGIYYYPNRWWSLAIPAWLVMGLVYIYVALASYNTGYLTLPMTSVENIVDEVATVAVIDSKGRRRPGGSEKMKPGSATSQTMSAVHNRRMHGHYASGSTGSAGGGTVSERGGGLSWKELWAEGTDAVMDIPVGGVCEVLYGKDRELDPDEIELDGEEEDKEDENEANYTQYKRLEGHEFPPFEDDDTSQFRSEAAEAYSSYSSRRPW
ncbi:PIG-P-domain-containing protein [Talaromyces proteolyticus]|uniref:PIG-P-domain-containing protein n=1 Tax=Talaromyces proteolyticus TaxID=1131652 RepID=A0AAD4PWG4_9EURO|nr:PIG-P-domain-containing protein [Talaromyces proteolyticus]KAH8697830.1 PIG-P-domain-containing protein [Talaromyces proteolyticus]